MKRIITAIAALLLGITVSTSATAVVPELIPLQGILTDDMGDPIDGAVTMTFNMYDSFSAVTGFWTEAQNVIVTEGFFTVYIGDVAGMPANFPSYTEVWMGIAVDSDPEMDRFQLGAVPYALEAQRCEQVGNLTETDINTNFAAASHNHDSDYLAITYVPSWNDLTDIPAGFADNTDDEGFTTEAELTALLDDNYAAFGHDHDADYMPITYMPDWNDLQNVPAGFADGIDDDTIMTYTAGSGLDLNVTEFYVPPDGIDATHLAPDSVGSMQIADNAVANNEMADNAIGNAEMANNAVDSAEIVTGAVDNAHLAGAIAPTKITNTAAVLGGTANQSFDSGTLYLDYTNNRVGVSDTTPDYGLDVGSTMHADSTISGGAGITAVEDVTCGGGASYDFTYSSAKTYYQMVGAEDFYSHMALSYSWEWYPGGSNYMYLPATANGASYMKAQVHLPGGADVTEVRCYYADTDATIGDDWNYGYMRLYSLNVTTGSSVSIAYSTVITANTTTAYHDSWADTSVSGTGDPVDNTTYSYVLYMYMDKENTAACTTNCRFYGCRIAYTMTVVGH